jgi:hypothetical protein
MEGAKGTGEASAEKQARSKRREASAEKQARSKRTEAS